MAYQQLLEVFDTSLKTYGYRRLVEGLKQKGIVMNAKKVRRIMNKYNLHPAYTKRKKKATYRRIEENVKHDLVKRKFKVNQPNQIWTTDITYLIYKGQTAYLSSILDLASRKVVAYQISRRNDNQLVLETLNQALKQFPNPQGLVLHSDQGFQYTSWAYKNVCQANGIRISMSRKGTPLDNSPQEIFHGLLKKETLYNYFITSLEDYIQKVIEWIQFYNTDRIRL